MCVGQTTSAQSNNATNVRLMKTLLGTNNIFSITCQLLHLQTELEAFQSSSSYIYYQVEAVKCVTHFRWALGKRENRDAVRIEKKKKKSIGATAARTVFLVQSKHTHTLVCHARVQ